MSTDDATLSRRGLIGVLGGGVASVAFGARTLDAFGAGDGTVATCVLTPEVTEGPYWIDKKLTRHDVREGRPGLPLVLDFTIVNARTCKPIRGADVEIWHADASGEYSGFDGGSSGGGPGGPGGGSGPQTKTRYLRGHQRSDPLGKASFLTIFPGWYRGRTPHVHMKVHVGAGRIVHTGQVFFNEAIQASVYRAGAYASRGQADTWHAQDMIYTQAGGSRAVVKLGRRPGGARGYVGRIVIGVATT
ncbi:MAG: dioxygenase family protein [Gaiellaceae bacterium]